MEGPNTGWGLSARGLSNRDADLELARFNRQQMLRRVRAIWIDGVLDHSLHQAALQEVGLPDPHWNLAVQPAFVPADERSAKAAIIKLLSQRASALADGSEVKPTIAELYDQARGKLLILGTPRSGKTTLLLQLARELLIRAEQDEGHPIPVILPLGSWRSSQPNLRTWVEAELRERYSIPKDVAEAWVANKQVLPLFDDLDAVPLDVRRQCSSSIASKPLTLPLLVVCTSSIEGCASLDVLMPVTLQPLTSQQVDAYLAPAGSKLEALRAALRDDSNLQELASTPSMLPLLALTYQNTRLSNLPSAAEPEARRQHILATYAQQRLALATATTPTSLAKMTRSLAWLARQIKAHQVRKAFRKAHQQKEVFLENLDPTWLDSRLASGIYRGLFMLGIMLPFMGLGICLLVEFSPVIKYVPVFTNDLHTNDLIEGLLLILLGLGLGIVFGWYHNWTPIKTWPWSWKNVQLALLVAAGTFIPIGVLCFGWIGLAYGSIWQGLLGGFLLGGLCTLAIGAIALGIVGPQSGMLEKSNHTTPNEGMRYALWNGSLIGLAWAVATMLLYIIVILAAALPNVPPRGLLGHASADWSSFDPVVALILVALIGLTGFFVNGGYPAVRQFVLRLFLWGARSMPFRWTPWLESAVQSRLLSRVGGDYVFAHPLLLDYFAELEQEHANTAQTH